jgi:hypothetical protein
MDVQDITILSTPEQEQGATSQRVRHFIKLYNQKKIVQFFI